LAEWGFEGGKRKRKEKTQGAQGGTQKKAIGGAWFEETKNKKRGKLGHNVKRFLGLKSPSGGALNQGKTGAKTRKDNVVAKIWKINQGRKDLLNAAEKGGGLENKTPNPGSKKKVEIEENT